MKRPGELPQPTMTATIGGAKTNRVQRLDVHRQANPRAGQYYDADPALETPERAEARWAAEPHVGVKVVAVSLPTEFLARLDEAARKARKSRSHYIRLAVERLMRGE